MDEATLADAVLGKSAVLSCLGISRKNPASPWTALLSPTNFTELCARKIVPAMTAQGVSRLVVLSAAGAGDSMGKVDAMTRLLFRISVLKDTVADSGRMEAVLQESGLDWLAIRPVRLVDSPGTGRAQVLERAKISGKIARSDVATWMLDAVERPGRFEGHCEMIGQG